MLLRLAATMSAQRQQDAKMAKKFRRYAMALACILLVAAPARADSTPPELKADIDSLIHRIEGAGRGVLQWDGAEKLDVRQDGATSVADIVNARILIGHQPPPAHPAGPGAEVPHPPPGARIVLDHIEVRRTAAADGTQDLAVVLPRMATVTAVGDPAEQAKLTLDAATVHALLDGPAERLRELAVRFDSARLDDRTTGGWVTFGPLSGSHKLVTATDGSKGWKSVGAYELKTIAFSFPKAAGGSIDRLAASGNTAGPDLAAANRVHDRLTALQQEDLPPPERAQAVLAVLPDLLSAYSQSKANFTIEGIAVHQQDTTPLFSLNKTGADISFNGLSGAEASLRITLKEDGLSVAASVPNADRMPTRGVADFGLENISTDVLRRLLAAAVAANEATTPPEHQAANQQMMTEVAALDPVFRIYDLAFDLKDAGVDAHGEAKGSPLSPKGYTADAALAVRNLDLLGRLMASPPLAAYLPLLKVIGTTAEGAGGALVTTFNLASAPGKWLTLNGNDVSAWLEGGPTGPGMPRLLRPSAPPLTGDDVLAVQHALAAAQIEVPPTGTYDGATAAAVARFQKANSLNVNGVVDWTTRRKLGIDPNLGERKGPN
jgi:hypothetical protein